MKFVVRLMKLLVTVMVVVAVAVVVMRMMVMIESLKAGCQLPFMLTSTGSSHLCLMLFLGCHHAKYA